MISGIKPNSINGHSPLPEEVYIEKSPLHGMGIFAKVDIPKEHDFGITHIADERFNNGYIRTSIGGFVNHSTNPNIELREQDDTLHLWTIKPVEKGEELTVDYTPYYTAEELATYR
ncbi:SET domain-containing protein-lysine N-methyltransferase [Candidatus Saccharibacteria bacterium]|nr:SET domain-containing protein-lysine N-methyltransferase [Candidatus Saccharibacteria bacterium]